MPAPVLPDSVSAELKNGVLRLRLLKSEKARAQKIPVRTEPAVPIIPRTPEPIPSV